MENLPRRPGPPKQTGSLGIMKCQLSPSTGSFTTSRYKSRRGYLEWETAAKVLGRARSKFVSPLDKYCQ